MSRITAVRSMTLASNSSSSRRSWPGDSSSSMITVSASSVLTMPASSSALPLPTNVPASGRGRRWSVASRTSAPAVSARRRNSSRDRSVSSMEPATATPTRMTRSSRSLRSSTSLISLSSRRLRTWETVCSVFVIASTVAAQRGVVAGNSGEGRRPTSGAGGWPTEYNRPLAADQGPADPVAALFEAPVRDGERQPDVALAARAVAGTWGDHHAGLLEQARGEADARLRGRGRQPDVQGALGSLDLPARVPEHLHDPVPPALVGGDQLGQVGQATLEGRHAGALDRVEDARVDVGLDPAKCLDGDLAAHRPADAPAGHVEDLRERAELERHLECPRDLKDRGGDEPVVGDLGIGVVMGQQQVVVGGEADSLLELVESGDRGGRVGRVVEPEKLGPVRHLAVDAAGAGAPAPGRRGRRTPRAGARCPPWSRSAAGPACRDPARRRTGGGRRRRSPRGAPAGRNSWGTGGSTGRGRRVPAP